MVTALCMATIMVPTTTAGLPNKRITILTPWYRQLRQLEQLVLVMVPVEQETEAEATVGTGGVPAAQARSLKTGDAVVIARIGVEVLGGTSQLLAQEQLPCPKMKENNESERRKHADVSWVPLDLIHFSNMCQAH